MKTKITTLIVSLVAVLSIGVGTASASEHSCPGAGSGNAVVVHNISCLTAGHLLIKSGDHMQRSNSHRFYVTTDGHRWLVLVQIKSAHRVAIGAAYDGSHWMGASIKY